MENLDHIEYDPRWDHAVDYLIKLGNYDKTRSFGVEVIEPPGPGDCQSWAFEQLGLPELAHEELPTRKLIELGFKETKNPQTGDLVVYDFGAHYGIFYRGNIKSKLGIEGAVCIHPLPAFAGNSVLKFYSMAPEPLN